MRVRMCVQSLAGQSQEESSHESNERTGTLGPIHPAPTAGNAGVGSERPLRTVPAHIMEYAVLDRTDSGAPSPRSTQPALCPFIVCLFLNWIYCKPARGNKCFPEFCELLLWCFVCLRQSLTVQPWLAWNPQCRSG
jgi:hypothetical protein